VTHRAGVTLIAWTKRYSDLAGLNPSSPYVQEIFFFHLSLLLSFSANRSGLGNESSGRFFKNYFDNVFG
jgi:hypothetical protein